MSRGNDLPAGYCLHEYVIAKTLGAGGFGITYLARDRNLDKAVAIKEFFPLSFATRYQDDAIGPVTSSDEMKSDYQHLLGRFIDEARTLGKFEHANVLRVLRYIEANSTAYIIMEYVEGPTLLKLVRDKQLLDEAELRPILLALIDGLRAVHSHGMLHRDIKPENIVLRGGRTPVLIDFGASREAIGRRGHSVTMMWTPGYAPIEQMSDEGELGPYSDIYALGATAYMALVGAPPGDSASRILQDRTVPAVIAAKDRASPAFLEAIDWAIKPFSKDRPQNVEDWLAAFEDGGVRKTRSEEMTMVVKPAKTKMTVPESRASAPKEAAGKKRAAIIAGAVVSVVIVGGLLLFGQGTSKQSDAGNNVANDSASSTQAVPQSQTPAGAQPAAPGATPAPKQAAPTRRVDPRDNADFEVARLVDSSEAYQLYLRIHPEGAHADQAQKLVRR